MKYLKKIIEYGLYLLVFLLPWQTRWIIKAGEINGGYFEYGTYSLYATDILLFFILFLFVVREIAASADYGLLAMTEKRVRDKKIIWWFIGGLVLASAVSVFFAIDKFLALYKLAWLFAGVGLFWLIVRADYKKIKLIYAWLLGAFLQAGLGIWQFINQTTFANKWLGLAMHRGADLGASVIETIGADGIGERWLRAYGGLDHPNILGGLLAIGIILIIYQIVVYEKNFGITNYELRITNKIKNAFLWLFLVVFTVGLFFSFSRGAWLALAVSLIGLAILAAVGRDLKSQKILAEIILIIGLISLALFYQCENLINTRLNGEGRLEIKSKSERLASYREAGQIIKKSWLFGAGPGNYTLALKRVEPERESYFYQPTHNVFLLVWAETGIFGLIFFILLLLNLLITKSHPPAGGPTTNKIQKYKLGFGPWGLGFRENDQANGLKVNLSILTAIIVIMMLDHWFFSLHFGGLFFWLILGIVTRGLPGGRADSPSSIPNLFNRPAGRALTDKAEGK